MAQLSNEPGNELTFIEIAGVVLLVLLFCQQFLIYRVRERHWPDAAFIYRRHFLAALLIVGAGILVLMMAFARWSPDADRGYESLLDGRAATVPGVFILATSIAIARILLERTFDEPKTMFRLVKSIIVSFTHLFHEPPDERREIKEWSGGLKLTPIWLAAFFMITLVEITAKLFNFRLSHLGSWGGIAFNLIAAACYFFWIYLAIFDKLVQEHHFSGTAARRFIGSVFQAFVPFQTVVIGPQRAGKTAFSRGAAVLDDDRTLSIEQSNVSMDARTSKVRFRALMSLLDTPGECLGDHVTAIAFYRTDFLVLVIRESHIDLRALAETPLKDDLQNLEEFFLDASGEYLHVLRQALRRAAPEDDSRAPQIYHVHRFCLFVNNDRDQAQTERITRNPTLIRMARLIGDRFGAKQECCFLLHAPATNGGAARQSLVDLEGLAELSRQQSAVIEPLNQPEEEPLVAPSP